MTHLRSSGQRSAVSRALQLAAALLWWCVPAHAADQKLQVSLINREDAPIQLVTGEGVLRTYQAIPTSRPSGASYSPIEYANVKHDQSDLLQWEGKASYRNMGRLPVDDVQLSWAFYDSFGQRKATIEVVDSRPILQGKARAQDWRQILYTPGASTATIKVSAVRFSDGTVWTAPQEAGDDEAASKTERERLRTLYQQGGVDALLDALDN